MSETEEKIYRILILTRGVFGGSEMADFDKILEHDSISPLEYNVAIEGKQSYLILPVTKLWIAIDLISRALLPSLLGLYSSFLRNPQYVVESVKNQLVPSVIAFLANNVSRSLASVQRIPFPTYLRLTENERNQEYEALETKKCLECLVLSQPTGERAADVIFIHGLHGGIEKTWKQGTWRHKRHKLNQQSPVRRVSSGNLFVPTRSQSLKRTLADIYSKIPNKSARRGDVCNVPHDFKYEEDSVVENNEDYSECWPKDWIHKDCPKARVIAVNYTTDVLWSPVWTRKRHRTNLVERSQEIIEELLKLNVGTKPIVWVGHSKGGLYIKQIIVNAWENHHGRHDLLEMFRQSRSIMWYSVPHKGSILADLTLPFLKRSVELLEVQRNCDFVLDLHKKFSEVIQSTNLKPEIFSFIETSFTLMAFFYMKIIAYESADPNMGVKCDVPLDHREICKPAGRDCFLYTELIKLINNCIENERKVKLM